ncbi:MAG: hypothetical protein KDI66_18455, partial [Xanthomonadales bacterium]|nr:hypothetical protein [Xanthomonadales bacterium]
VVLALIKKTQAAAAKRHRAPWAGSSSGSSNAADWVVHEKGAGVGGCTRRESDSTGKQLPF